MGMREVMQALSEGAGRQSAIGGLMFQDAQMREGRSYEAAMAKEKERRTNLEWSRRERQSAGTAEDVAAQSALTAEGVAEQADTYRLGQIEAQGQISKDVTQLGIDADVAAAKEAHETWKKQFEEKQIEAQRVQEATAKSELELKKWEAKSKALLGRAEKEDTKTLEAYKQLVENPAFTDEDGNWNENVQYLEEFAKAQARSDKAWSDYLSYSGIKISQPKPTDTWGPMAMTLSADLRKSLKPKEWDDLIKGLATGVGPAGKGGKSYDEAIARIKKAVTDLGIDFMPSQAVEIQERMAEVLTKMAAEGAEGTQSVDLGDDEVEEAVTHDITEAMGPTDEGEPTTIPSSSEVMATLSLNVPQSELPDLMERANVAKLEADERATGIENYIQSYLKTNGLDVEALDIRKYILTGADDLRDSATGKIHSLTPEIEKHLNKYRAAWKDNALLRGKIEVLLRRIQQRTGGIGLNIKPTASVEDMPRGILDTGNRGMISMADNRGWSPEEVDARAISALEQRVA